MCFNNSNLPRSAQIPPWRLQPVGKSWRNAHRSLEGLSIASFHFSQHPGAEQNTPSENLCSNQTCCLSGVWTFYVLFHRISWKMMHVTSIVASVHFFQGLCSWTINKRSSLASQKKTSSNHAPKKTTEVHRIPSTQRVFFDPRLEHSPWAPFMGEMCQIRWFPGKKRWKYGLWGLTMLAPLRPNCNFRTCKGGVGSASSRQPPSRSAVSWGTAIRPANQINLEQWPISQSPWLSTSLQNRCPQSHQSRTWWVYKWFNPKKWHQRILNVNFEGNFRYCFASGFLRF